MLCCDACSAHGAAAKPIQPSFSGCKPTGLWSVVEPSEGDAKRMCKRQQQPPLALTAEGLCNHQVGQRECQQTEQGSQSCAGDGWMGQDISEQSERRATKCGLYRSAYRGSSLQAAYISTTNSAATTCLTVGGSPDNEQESEEGAGLPSEVAGLSDARKVGSADLVQTLQSSQHRYSGPACSWLKHGWGTNLPPRGALPSCAAAGTEPTCTPCPCPLPYWRLQKNARHTRHAPSK